MIELKFTKPLALNAQLNKARTNRYVAASSKKIATLRAKREALEQTQIKLICPVYIAYEITYSTATSDADNLNSCLKPIMDGIIGAGILRDDSLNYIQPVSFIKYTKQPRSSQYVKVFIFTQLDALKQHIEENILLTAN